MTHQYEASKPIYLQIAEQVYQQIIRGEIKPGDKLPSVRDMAIQTGVNPNTIQRSYSEMEGTGVVETKRGQGTFVIERESVVDELKQQLQQEVMTRFVESMHELGFSSQDMLKGLEQFIQEGDKDGN